MKVYVKLTNGFGNNLFQYIAGRLLSEYHGAHLILIPPYQGYYGVRELDSLGLEYDLLNEDFNNSKSILVSDINYQEGFKKKISNENIVLQGYFENYNYYINSIEKIKSWFPRISKKLNNDLVFHLRLGDRLLHKVNYHKDGSPVMCISRFLAAINKFNFNKIYIVTDMPVWGKISLSEFKRIKYHTKIDVKKSINFKYAHSYFNSLICGFEKLNPIIRHSNISNDFQFIRKFDKILFQHSTFAWWAAILSDATRVGVYGPWRPNKKNNKNLSEVQQKGWFKWN